MSSIAKRAHSSIGSLYQFFPNKRSLTEALRAEYVGEIEQYWLALADQSPSLTPEQLACRLVTLQLEIVAKYPALLALLDVPATAKTSKGRELIRTRIAAVLTAHKPRISEATALRAASVVQQVSRALLALYRQAQLEEKPAIVDEFKCVMKGYLAAKLKS